MHSETFRDICEEERHFRAMQMGRYSHAYSITLRVPNDRRAAATAVSAASLRRSAILAIEEDAEFHITHISASVMAPVGENSNVRDVNMQPTMPMAGVTTGRSDRGLAFRISEVGSGRLLTGGQTRTIGPNQMGPAANTQNWWWAREGYLALESVFPPSYAFEMLAPVPFEFFLQRTRRLQVDFINRDSDYAEEEPGAGLGGHYVTFVFLGQRYDA